MFAQIASTFHPLLFNIPENRNEVDDECQPKTGHMSSENGETVKLVKFTPDNEEQNEEQDKKEETKNENIPVVEWLQLPSNLVVEIYRCLPDTDKFNFSLVCKKWSGLFGSATLWRELHVRFGGMHHYKNEALRILGFAKQNGKHIKTLSIVCQHPTFSLCKHFQRTMTEFLNALNKKNTQLTDFYACQLFSDRYWRYEFCRERLVASLARFLKRQKKMNTFDMSDAMFHTANGIKILDAISQGIKDGGGRKLEYLELEDFFQSRTAIYATGRFQKIMSRFKNLKHISINYNYLSEDILETVAINCAGTLRTMKIKIYRHDPHVHQISDSTWKIVKRHCPKLSITVYFEGIGKYTEISRCLPHEIPVENITIWTGVHSLDETWDVHRTFCYLADHFGKRLVSASFGIENGREPIDDAVVYFVSHCKMLEYFEMQGILLVSTLSVICKLQEEYKIALQKCHINCENLTGVDIDDLDELNLKYLHMIDERGLDWKLEANEMVLF